MVVQSPLHPARRPERARMPALTGWVFAARDCACVLGVLPDFWGFII